MRETSEEYSPTVAATCSTMCTVTSSKSPESTSLRFALWVEARTASFGEHSVGFQLFCGFVLLLLLVFGNIWIVRVFICGEDPDCC